MGMGRDPRPLIERQHVKDTFVSDLGRIDILGENVRFVLYVDQFDEEGGTAIRVIEAKVVMPKSVILSAISRVLFALGHCALSPDGSSEFLSRSH